MFVKSSSGLGLFLKLSGVDPDLLSAHSWNRNAVAFKAIFFLHRRVRLISICDGHIQFFCGLIQKVWKDRGHVLDVLTFHDGGDSGTCGEKLVHWYDITDA